MADARDERGSSQARHLPRVRGAPVSGEALVAGARLLLHSPIQGVHAAHDVEPFKRLHIGVQEAHARSPVSIDGEAGFFPSENAELMRSTPKAQCLWLFFNQKIFCQDPGVA